MAIQQASFKITTECLKITEDGQEETVYMKLSMDLSTAYNIISRKLVIDIGTFEMIMTGVTQEDLCIKLYDEIHHGEYIMIKKPNEFINKVLNKYIELRAAEMIYEDFLMRRKEIDKSLDDELIVDEFDENLEAQ